VTGLTDDPIVVGALGGSGTRVVAQMLGAAGVYLGHDLNDASDNLWFTLLFRHPSAFFDLGRRPDRLVRRLDVFEQAMAGTLPRRPSTVATLLAPAGAHWRDGSEGAGWIARRCVSMVRSSGPGPDATRWGWKEPNTHVFLPLLVDRYPGMRYVHVFRHGLDMAFSANQNQLHRWGGILGVERGDLPDHRWALRYWSAATRRAVELARPLGDRFLLLNYDELCDDPEPMIDRFLAFAGLAGDAAHLSTIVDPPTSRGRYRARLDEFTADDLALVTEWGFEV
jgi:hypothetical protein